MISVTENFATDFQEFKASTAERIDKIVHLIWENVMGNDTVQAKDIKQQKELLQNEIKQTQTESPALLKVIELLLVQQINTQKIDDNTEKIITVKRLVKTREKTEPLTGLPNFTQ